MPSRINPGSPTKAPELGDSVKEYNPIPRPFGLSQGVYRVSRGPDGRPVVAPPIAAEGRVVRGDPARRPIDVNAFVQQVRTAMGRQP